MQACSHFESFAPRELFFQIIRRAGTIALAVACIASTVGAHAQGCVAAHGSGLACLFEPGDQTQADKWDASISYRWFKSNKHYVGTTYQAQRTAAGDQVINHSNFTDLSLSYTISPRYNVSLTIPYVSHDRSQVVKDSTGVILDRYSTQSSGIADISVLGNAWIFERVPSSKGNVQVGFGFSLPTGRDDAHDIFQVYDKASGKILGVDKTVDQSIQPGIGGYGLIFNVAGYRQLGAGFTGYASGLYSATPQEKNGVPTFRSSVYESVMSIADTYLLRAGVEYAFGGPSGVSLSLGLRDEGVPVYDLIGGSKGFRRPGYSIAIEPGISINRPKWSARLYVPLAIQRDRQQSVPDKQRTAATGVYSQGDAAFADYLIACSFSCKL